MTKPMTLEELKEKARLTDEKFLEWCGSHQVKGCGKAKDMCETVCRPQAQVDKALQTFIQFCEANRIVQLGNDGLSFRSVSEVLK